MSYRCHDFVIKFSTVATFVLILIVCCYQFVTPSKHEQDVTLFNTCMEANKLPGHCLSLVGVTLDSEQKRLDSLYTRCLYSDGDSCVDILTKQGTQND